MSGCPAFRSRVLGVAFGAMVTVATPIEAQEALASLSGRVLDERRQPLAGLLVTAQEQDVPLPWTVRTAPNGEYFFPSLPAGHYVIAFTHAGRVPVKRVIHLSPAERTTADVVMNPDNGFDGAVTVIHEKLMFPPQQGLALEPRTVENLLPVTGTLPTVIALSTIPIGIAPTTGLFLLDDLPLRHGWRVTSGDAFAGPGREAIRELAIAPASLPATVGRAEAGLVTVVTLAGSSRPAGSAYASFGSAGSSADLLSRSPRIDGIAGTTGITFGGPLRQGSTWGFATGQHLAESTANDTALMGVGFTSETTDRLGLARLLHRLADSHRVEAQWIGTRRRLTDVPPIDDLVADTRALERRTISDRAVSVAYTGLVGGRLHLSTRYTRENGSAAADSLLADTGALADRTPVIDLQSGIVSWAPQSCIACESRRVTHNTWRGAAAALLPGRLSRHHITAGVDLTRDALNPSAPPAGGSFQLFATRLDTAGDVVLPVFAPGGSSWIAWSPEADNRMRVRSDAFLVSDRWSASEQLTIDLGMRLDRFGATSAATGVRLLSEQGFSPRLAATWRPSLAMPWTVNAGYGRYLPGVFERSIDFTFLTMPSQRVFVYDGPPINGAGTPTAASDAVGSVLDWFAATGGTSREPWLVSDPGVSTTAAQRNAAPSVDEWSFGLSRMLGADGWLRADLTSRSYGRFSTRRVSPGTPPAIDAFGGLIDAGVLERDDRLERRYDAFTLSADYRFGHWADVRGRYTMSSLRGNVDEATLSGDWPASGVLGYREFAGSDWHLPIGALPDDVRHRMAVAMHSELIADDARGTLMMAVLFTSESGRPYGASGLVAVAPFVSNPGYRQVPIVARYFFTERDAFRTAGMMRVDMGLVYRRPLPRTALGEIVAQFDVLNLTGRTDVRNPALLALVRTALTDPGLQPFNPFTEVPVADVHWRLDDRDVQSARTMGRAVRVSLAVRF